ncbi:hypothetical protein R6V09_20535 [Streptomyces sp. W16]|uniref:hypothetical protein n=1 Tax=Streptomyces sp. W16 TaxID=3076631 RepID=UPI00295C308F|nr:hypothetical protein [Streptomyces sp. W16]MDV9172481.1 hypothetical protein [Streptomyces sp. W16]
MPRAVEAVLTAAVVDLAEPVRARLHRPAASATAQVRQVLRAKIVLAAADGRANAAIGAQVVGRVFASISPSQAGRILADQDLKPHYRVGAHRSSPDLKEPQAVDVEIPALVRDAAARFGAGAPYALKVVAGQLADDPDMGVPSRLPGIRTVLVDGDLFEDCPALAVGYLHEPDRIEIRYVTLAPAAEPDADAREQEREREEVRRVDPDVTAVTVREVADAWHRITRRLRDNAPDSYAALRTGADLAAVAALEGELGVRIPVELTVLWLLTAGDDGADGRGCLPGNRALLPLDEVAAVHRLKTDAQAHQDTANAGRPEEEWITVWKPTWIPVAAHSPGDRVSGLYLDTETGFLGRWSRYDDHPDDERDTLVTYLEETADALEAPALAPRDEPGLIGGTLVWRSAIDPAREDRWRPLRD